MKIFLITLFIVEIHLLMEEKVKMMLFHCLKMFLISKRLTRAELLIKTRFFFYYLKKIMKRGWIEFDDKLFLPRLILTLS